MILVSPQKCSKYLGYFDIVTQRCRSHGGWFASRERGPCPHNFLFPFHSIDSLAALSALSAYLPFFKEKMSCVLKATSSWKLSLIPLFLLIYFYQCLEYSKYSIDIWVAISHLSASPSLIDYWNKGSTLPVSPSLTALTASGVWSTSLITVEIITGGVHIPVRVTA